MGARGAFPGWGVSGEEGLQLVSEGLQCSGTQGEQSFSAGQSLSPQEGEGANGVFIRARSSVQRLFEEEMTTSLKRKEKGT